MILLNQRFKCHEHALIKALGDLLIQSQNTYTLYQNHHTYTHIFPVKLMCGHLWGLHITATTAIYKRKINKKNYYGYN